MEAQGDSTSFQTPHVAGAIVILAVLGLVLLNRLTLNVAIGR
jgi:hypothetical protein